MKQSTLLLSAAVDAYFEAKSLLFQDVPDFRLLDVGPLKCLHKHPNWPEVDGFYALNVSPAEAVAALQDYQPDPNHMVTVFTSAPETLIKEYRQLGYQPIPWAEPFMLRSLSGLKSVDERPAIHARQTPTTMDYWIEEDGQPVCWGRSMMTSQKAVYISGMETQPAFRRRGLASALLRRIHTDAAQKGILRSILCSSPMGLPLYQAAGYSVVAQMQAFVPKRSTDA